MQKVSERFGQIIKIGLEKDFLEDLYHSILKISWPRFISAYVLFFLVFNLIFAFLYWLDLGSVTQTDGNFFRDFSFSVQTFSTIGYGLYAPTDTYAHILVIIEAVLGVLCSALLTGLTFAKFSRPTARIQFTDKIVITNYNGQRMMMFRLANLRGNQIAEASIRATALCTQTTAEGDRMRLQKDIKFIRQTSSFFILSWTVMHLIDNESPFYNRTSEDLIRDNIDISVSVIGHDETFSQTVHASCIYSPQDIVFDKKFEDILNTQSGRATVIDFTKFNLLKDATPL